MGVLAIALAPTAQANDYETIVCQALNSGWTVPALAEEFDTKFADLEEYTGDHRSLAEWTTIVRQAQKLC
ncbi:hypothetical protein PBI_NEBKISS_163 [Mycobacterium phage Nebkiss]|nr:hypothetical protein PBI_NEBKISS_163 [Mycobacterium phage Nebkiss]